jgi:hypothetical protein
MNRNEKRIALLDEAISIIKSLPDSAVAYGTWESVEGELVVADPGGWLGERQLGGLRLSRCLPRHSGLSEEDFCSSEHLAFAMDIPYERAVWLFEDPFWDGEDFGVESKCIWLARADHVRSQMVAGTLPFYDGEME